MNNLFKKGDKVVRTVPGTAIPVGTICTIKEYIADSSQVILEEYKGRWYTSSFKLKEKLAEKQEDSTTKWEFKVHSVHEIDKKEIQDSLTRKNPVALVTVDGGALVLYHYSIEAKAKYLGMHAELVLSERDFSKAIAFAKKVRNTPWNLQEKVVKVSLPTI